jgi:excisionase family DNA binding protein
VGINTAIRTVEAFLNEAKDTLKARGPDRQGGGRAPARRPALHDTERATALDSQARGLVKQEVRAAVHEALGPVLEHVKGGVPGDVVYLSVEKAAATAEVHPDTIRAWVKAGRLPEHRAGRELRIRRDELHRFLDRVGDGDVRPTAEDEAALILARRRSG